jgi:predicted MFS family arabinose efflux permease
MVGPDDLTNAVGLNSASFNMARIVGPAVAGVLIALLGSGVQATGTVILLNAVSYVAVIYALQRMRESELDTPERVRRGKGMIRDGVRYVRGRPDVMLVLAIVFFAGTFGMNFQMTSALMATQVYHKGAGEYGLLGTTMAIGSLTGALLAARRVGKPRFRLLVVAAMAFGLVEIASGVMPSYVSFMVITPVLGLSALTMITSANATVQLSVSPAMRGRVMALYMMIFQGGTPLGAPIVGWVGDTFGARWTLIGGGAITILGIALAVAVFGWSRGLLGPRRRMPRRPEAAEVPELADRVVAGNA